jgi:tRNA pseudouridine38-40 synthase
VPRYRLLLEYDGSVFHGWQIQPNGPTVQDAVERALEVLLRYRPDVVGSGRTDAGVHARGQVAHFDTLEPVEPLRASRSLNGLLPRAVRVRRLSEVDDSFHARYDAVSRRYHYYVSTVPTALQAGYRWLLIPAPDFDRMNEAAALLLGTHDFDAFCRIQSETVNRVCTVSHARFVPEIRDYPDGDAECWRFEVVADRFLHGMVRAIVGTLVQIGRGNRDVESIEEILGSRDRRMAGPAAPAHGLVLEHVGYSSRKSERE